jgi:hypothetical protein
MAGRFKIGHSGNKAGRPRLGAEDYVSPIEELVRSEVSIIDRGVSQKVPMGNAIKRSRLMQAFNRKNMQAARVVVDWIIENAAYHRRKSKKRFAAIQQLTSADPNNADAALLILGIVSHDPADERNGSARMPVRINAWATSMALRRRHGGQRLASGEIEEIKRRTADAETVRWPKGEGNDD